MSEKDVLEPLNPLDMYLISPWPMRSNPPTTIINIAINFAPVNKFCVPVAKLTL